MLFGKRQQLTICILAAMLVADFVLFAHMPLRQRLKQIEQKKSEYQHSLVTASSQSQQLSSLKQKLTKLQDAVSNYELNVPVERDLGTFLQQVTNLMNKYGLSDQRIQPGQEIETDKLKCIPIDIQCKGTLKKIFKFYKSLQGLDRLIRIEEVKIINDGDFKGQVSMQAKATIYCRVQADQR